MTEPAHPSHTPEEASPAAGHAAAPANPLPFSADEWQMFRRSDKTAGTYIVGIMASIFSVGLVLYLIVLLSVST